MSGSAIKQNKLRSILSVLGITIGIFCIISVYALVHSLEKSLNNQFSKFGSDVVFIQKWPWDEFGNNYPWWKYLKRPVTKPEEADFLVDRITPNKVKEMIKILIQHEEGNSNEIQIGETYKIIKNTYLSKGSKLGDPIGTEVKVLCYKGVISGKEAYGISINGRLGWVFEDEIEKI
jgi:ABC-type antimicrobial peptide transport system permease subunit